MKEIFEKEIFEDVRGTKYSLKRLQSRLVEVFKELDIQVWCIIKAKTKDEVELEIKKAKALIEIAKIMTELYNIFKNDLINIYEK